MLMLISIYRCIKNKWLAFDATITPIDIVIFFQQLSALLHASIPIAKCFSLLVQIEQKPRLRTLLLTLQQQLLNGRDLCACLNSYPIYFNELTCQLIRVGEHTGKLDEVLNAIANQLKRNVLLQQKLKQILFYPAIVVSVAFMMTLGLLLFVIPRFAELFQTTQVDLPLLTKCIFYLSNLINTHWQWLLFFVVGGSIAAWHYKFSRFYQLLINHLPLQFFKHLNEVRFARYFALTLTAGLPIGTALPLIAPTCDRHYMPLILRLHRKIAQGQSVYQAMLALGEFPSLMLQLVKIGEDAGILEHMLNKFADFTENQIEKLTQRFHQWLEPLIMLMLGALIGGLVIGMYLPIFRLGTTI